MLAKSTRRDPADLPVEPERLLDSPTYEGFPIRPLYTALDGSPEDPLPGRWPFVRGGDALRDVNTGWKVAEAFPTPVGAGEPRVGELNGAVLLALTEGVSALVLRVGEAGVAPGDLDRLLEGVFLELVPVVVDAGADFVAAADALLALAAQVDEDKHAMLSIDLGADPLTAPLSGRPAPSLEDVIATASRAGGYRGRSAGDHRGRARLPQPRRERVLGTGGRRRCGCGLPTLAWRAHRGAGAAADQLSLRRRRRPVHDDREIPCGTSALGPGGRGGRCARRVGRRPCTQSPLCR